MPWPHTRQPLPSNPQQTVRPLLLVVPLDLPLVRQLGVAPGSHAARQVDHLLAARLSELLGSGAAPPPVRTGADKGAVGAHLSLNLQHRGGGSKQWRRQELGRLAAACQLPEQPASGQQSACPCTPRATRQLGRHSCHTALD